MNNELVIELLRAYLQGRKHSARERYLFEEEENDERFDCGYAMGSLSTLCLCEERIESFMQAEQIKCKQQT